jgi:hypothetical protein
MYPIPYYTMTRQSDAPRAQRGAFRSLNLIIYELCRFIPAYKAGAFSAPAGKDQKYIRFEMVRFARKHGIKPATRCFLPAYYYPLTAFCRLLFCS